jgi:quercetin dioxygenase-like cupin family protein
LAAPFLEFDLMADVARLQHEPTWDTGRNARTLVKFDDFRVVLTTLKANQRMPEHKTEARISLHILAGHLRVTAEGRTFDLRPGSLLALDCGTTHDIEARQDSSFLLTMAWTGSPKGRSNAM